MTLTELLNGARARVSLEPITGRSDTSATARDTYAIWSSIEEMLLTYAKWEHAQERVVLKPRVITTGRIAPGHRGSVIARRPDVFAARSFRWRMVLRYRDQHRVRVEYEIRAPSDGDYIPELEALEEIQSYENRSIDADLSTPTDLSARGEDGYVVVAWTDVEGANDYAYRFRAGRDGNWTTVITTNGRNTVTVHDLPNGHLYQFQVLALADSRISQWSDAVSGVPTAIRVPILLAPPIPTGLKATVRSRAVLLEWNRVANATSYQHRRRRAGDPQWEIIASPVVVQPQVVSVGLDNGVPYEFEVRAVNIWGPSGWTDTVRATPATVRPDTPTGLVAIAGDRRARITWNGVADVTRYRYRFRRAVDEHWTVPANQPTHLSRALVVQNLSNGTVYHFQVRAENAAGASLWSDHVAVIPTNVATPVPANLTVAAGDQQAIMTWDHVGNAIHYDARYRRVGVGSWTEFLGIASTTNTYTAPNLSNGVTYEFQVRASRGTNGGVSLWSGSVTAVPRVAAPDRPPRGLRANEGDRHVIVFWDADVPRATHYQVRHREQGAAEWSAEADYLSSVLSYTFHTGLENGKTYEYAVRATNAGGASAWSSSITATPRSALEVPAVPAPRVESTASQTVKVAWGAVTGATDYDVRYRVKDTRPDLTDNQPGEWTSDTDTGDTATSHTFTGLTNNVEYEFSVRAGNAEGESDWSAPVSATPNINAPSAPTNFAAAVRENEIGLSWSRVTGAASYDYRWKKDTESAWTQRSTTALEVRVLNLEAVLYDFEVRATNSAGSSDWVALTATPNAATVTANKVSGLRASRGNQQVALSWTNDDAQTYEIQYRAEGVSAWTAGPSGLTGNSRTITGLNNGTRYEFQVRGTYDGTPGDWSDSAYATPLIAPGRVTGVDCDAGDGSADVSWSARPTAERVTGYTVYWREVGGSWQSRTTTGPSLTLTLNNGTTYQVEVSATNDAGEGSRSSTDSCTPQASVQAPGTPTVNSVRGGRKQITVIFTPADATATSFPYRYRSGSTWTNATLGASGGGQKTLVIDELRDNTTYQVQVAARNSAGSSTYTSVRSATTDRASAPLVTGTPQMEVRLYPDGVVAVHNLRALANAESFRLERRYPIGRNTQIVFGPISALGSDFDGNHPYSEGGVGETHFNSRFLIDYRVRGENADGVGGPWEVLGRIGVLAKPRVQVTRGDRSGDRYTYVFRYSSTSSETEDTWYSEFQSSPTESFNGVADGGQSNPSRTLTIPLGYYFRLRVAGRIRNSTGRPIPYARPVEIAAGDIETAGYNAAVTGPDPSAVTPQVKRIQEQTYDWISPWSDWVTGRVPSS